MANGAAQGGVLVTFSRRNTTSTASTNGSSPARGNSATAVALGAMSVIDGLMVNGTARPSAGSRRRALAAVGIHLHYAFVMIIGVWYCSRISSSSAVAPLTMQSPGSACQSGCRRRGADRARRGDRNLREVRRSPARSIVGFAVTIPLVTGFQYGTRPCSSSSSRLGPALT